MSQARTDCAPTRLVAPTPSLCAPSVTRLLRRRFFSPAVAEPTSQTLLPRPRSVLHQLTLHSPCFRALAKGNCSQAVLPAQRAPRRSISPLIERTKCCWNSTLSVSFRILHSSANELAWTDAKTVHLPCKRCQVLYDDPKFSGVIWGQSQKIPKNPKAIEKIGMFWDEFFLG